MGYMEEQWDGISGTGQLTQAAKRHSVEHLYLMPGSIHVYVPHLSLAQTLEREVVEHVLAQVRT